MNPSGNGALNGFGHGLGTMGGAAGSPFHGQQGSALFNTAVGDMSLSLSELKSDDAVPDTNRTSVVSDASTQDSRAKKESAPAKKPQKVRRCTRVCQPCRKAKSACAEERPCPRCVRLCCEDSCIDVEYKGNRGQKKKVKSGPKKPVSPAGSHNSEFVKELSSFLAAPETDFPEDSLPVILGNFLNDEPLMSQPPLTLTREDYHKTMHSILIRWKVSVQSEINIGNRDYTKELTYFLLVKHVQVMAGLRGIDPALVAQRQTELFAGFDPNLDTMSFFANEKIIPPDFAAKYHREEGIKSMVYDNLPVATTRFSMFNLVTKITYTNQAMCDLMQMSASEIMSAPLNIDFPFRFVKPSAWALVPGLFGEAIAGQQESFKLRCPMVRKSGEVVDCLMTVSMDYTPTGMPIFATIFTSPISGSEVKHTPVILQKDDSLAKV
eukprot:Clim_evm38s251 gene=Clim_evmTU38s251